MLQPRNTDLVPTLDCRLLLAYYNVSRCKRLIYLVLHVAYDIKNLIVLLVAPLQCRCSCQPNMAESCGPRCFSCVFADCLCALLGFSSYCHAPLCFAVARCLVLLPLYCCTALFCLASLSFEYHRLA